MKTALLWRESTVLLNRWIWPGSAAASRLGDAARTRDKWDKWDMWDKRSRKRTVAPALHRFVRPKAHKPRLPTKWGSIHLVGAKRPRFRNLTSDVGPLIRLAQSLTLLQMSPGWEGRAAANWSLTKY